MSGTYMNSDGKSDLVNAESAHDTGLYDPARHDNQIVAMYETNERAHAAQDALVQAGVSSGAIQVIDRSMTNTNTNSTDQGFWGSIRSLFVPDDDVNAYGHALDHGHAMLVVHPDTSMDRSHVIQVLESTDPVDFDAKLEEWRQTGYDYSSHPMTGGAVGAAAGMATSAGMATPAHFAESEVSAQPAFQQTTSPMTAASPFAEATDNTAVAAPADTDTIKLMEERLRVGKREVAAGAVRIRSYVVERPVEEQVHLHEEHVTLERRPVDRPATSADLGAFQERTIEARATAEEAVVSKTAHVVEEIGLRKDATDRTETVHDTVRRTEVEVDDTTAAGKPMTTGGTVTNATPGATSSGTNTPRK